MHKDEHTMKSARAILQRTVQLIKTVEVDRKYAAEGLDQSCGGWKDPSDPSDLNKNVKLMWPPVSEIMYLYKRFTKGIIEFDDTKAFTRTLVINS